MKKVTWNDVLTFNRGLKTEDRDLLVKREWKATHRIPNADGRSYFHIDCPFCKTRNTVYVWSFAGQGKRCEVCGAMFSWFGEAYQFKSNNKRKDLQ